MNNWEIRKLGGTMPCDYRIYCDNKLIGYFCTLPNAKEQGIEKLRKKKTPNFILLQLSLLD